MRFLTLLKSAVVSLLAVGFALMSAPSQAQTEEGKVRVPGSLYSQATETISANPSALVGDDRIPMIFALPLKDRDGAIQAIHDLYDPKSPNYLKFYSTQDFADQFGPSQDDYDAIVAYVKSLGMTVSAVDPDRLVLEASATKSQIEKSFDLKVLQATRDDGSACRIASVNPLVPISVANRLTGIFGIDNSIQMKPKIAGNISPLQSNPSGGIGTGYHNYFSPDDIRKAYGLTASGTAGAGQVLGLVEFDGYVASNIQTYADYYGITGTPPLTPVSVSGRDTSTHSGGNNQSEVELDIEMMLALAPKAQEIRVYEAPNSNVNILSILSAMINESADHRPYSISESWSIAETSASYTDSNNASLQAFFNSEDALFLQLAGQGQSYYASSGDNGPYGAAYKGDDCTIAVQDPSTQPWVTSVGGTTLSLSDGDWSSETPWWDGNTCGSGTLGGGGGISHYWDVPPYQSGFVLAATDGDPSKRNTPDVSLNADLNTGYSIYSLGAWYGAGGTSASAPLWAAFNALVNQARSGAGLPPLGFPNPTLYAIAGGANYSTNFHDIASGSNGGVYPAVANYDLATGWGTPIMDHLLTTLTNYADVVPPDVSIGFGSNYSVAVPYAIDSAYNGGQTFDATGHSYIEVLTQDASSGFNGIFVISSGSAGNYEVGAKQYNNGTNATPDWRNISLPISYTSNPIREYFVKKNASDPASLTFSVQDQAGNYGKPDINVQSLSFASKDQTQERTFASVEKEQGRLSILASGGDLKSVRLTVNGESVDVGNIAAGAVSVVDLRGRLRGGDQNEIKVSAEGDASVKATLLVSSARLMNPDASSTATSGDAQTSNPLDAYARGDLNRDGAVNASDAIYLLRLIAGYGVSDANLLTLGDMNQDGRLDINDAVALIKKIVGQ